MTLRLSLRTGRWARRSTSLLEFEKHLMSLLSPESGIQLVESGILKSGIQPLMESEIHGHATRNPRLSCITLHRVTLGRDETPRHTSHEV